MNKKGRVQYDADFWWLCMNFCYFLWFLLKVVGLDQAFLSSFVWVLMIVMPICE